METDDLGRLVLVEVTVHGIAHVGLELAQSSASVKIEGPSARAVYPPSGDSSTMKMTSSIDEAPAILIEGLIQDVDLTRTARRPPLRGESSRSRVPRPWGILKRKMCQKPITFQLGPFAGTKRHIQADQETGPDTFDTIAGSCREASCARPWD